MAQTKEKLWKIDKSVKVIHAQLTKAPMVLGGLVGAELSLSDSKAKGIEIYLQPNDSLMCYVPPKDPKYNGWFKISASNWSAISFDKSVEFE